MASLTPADRVGIADLVSDYARCVDERDYVALAGLFAPGARIAVSLRAVADASIVWCDDIEAWVHGVRERHSAYLVTTHFVGQQRAWKESDWVKGETYCLAHHLYDGDGLLMNRVMAIRYRDRFVQSGRAWQFQQRQVVVDWIEYRPTEEGPSEDRRLAQT